MCFALIFPASLMAAIIFTWTAICSGDPTSKFRDHYINLHDCLHQAFMMIYVSLWNNHMTFKINILIQSNENTPTMRRTRVCTYMEKCYSRALEALNEFGLFRIWSCVFSDQCKSGVPSFRTFLHYVFSNVSSPSNYQNLAFLSHSDIISNEID